MRLRQLYAFNLVMLGKKDLRLMTNQDTIVTQVFKTKYFPTIYFLEAQLGHNLSFIWCSIHASWVVVKGVWWRIDNGNSIHAWNQPWLKNHNDIYISSSPHIGNQHLKVSDLIHHESCTWRLDVLNANFNQPDVQKIQSIPLLNTHGSDQQIWKFSSTGDYTVRSAYHNIMETMLDVSHLKAEADWMLVWKLQIPHNIKQFIWRLLRGCLPTRYNLRTKQITCPLHCVRSLWI